MPVTLKDIAKETNLSVTTVSLVLNKKKCRVSDSTRALILDTAKRLNYYPNQLAIGLVKQQTNTVGLIIPDISNHFYSNLALGIDKEMLAHNHNIILINTNYEFDRVLQAIQVLKARNVDAIILTAASVFSHDLDAYSKIIDQTNIPIITIDHSYPTLNCSAVQLNNKKGAYIAVRHLITRGHKNIVCITGPSHSTVTQERLAGYKLAFEDAGLALPPKYVFPGNYCCEGGNLAASDIIRETNATAIFAFNDVMALGAYQRLRAEGISIPKDMSVVGFDNIDFSDMLDIPLTTVNQPAYEIGREAAKRALYEIEHPDSEKRTITFEPQLIVRNSTRDLTL